MAESPAEKHLKAFKAPYEQQLEIASKAAVSVCGKGDCRLKQTRQLKGAFGLSSKCRHPFSTNSCAYGGTVEHALAPKPRSHKREAEQLLRLASKCCYCLQTLSRLSLGSTTCVWQTSHQTQLLATPCKWKASVGTPVLSWEGIKREETPFECQIHTHRHLSFGVESGQELTRSLVSPFPFSPGVMPCCCESICFWKAREWTRLGISFCTTAFFHKSRDEHFLPLVCVPTPCLYTHRDRAWDCTTKEQWLPREMDSWSGKCRDTWL